MAQEYTHGNYEQSSAHPISPEELARLRGERNPGPNPERLISAEAAVEAALKSSGIPPTNPETVKSSVETTDPIEDAIAVSEGIVRYRAEKLAASNDTPANNRTDFTLAA